MEIRPKGVELEMWKGATGLPVGFRGVSTKKINYFVLETRNIGPFSYFLVFEKSFKIFVTIIVGLRI